MDTVSNKYDAARDGAVAVVPIATVDAIPTATATSLEIDMAATTTPIDVVEQKQGGRCCGCCCDYRIAVMALQIFAIVSSVLPIIVGATNEFFDYVDALNVIFGVLNFVAGFVGLLGAVRFNATCLAVAIAWDFILIGYLLYGLFTFLREKEFFYFVYIFFYYSLGVCFYGFLVYPTVCLLLEIKKGVMNKETYDRRERRCC